jgi:sulfur carrier protein
LVKKGDNVRIFVNGEEKTIESTTILGYLNEIEIDPQRIAVELNLDILPKGDYSTTRLKDGDRIEIVHFVGGG